MKAIAAFKVIMKLNVKPDQGTCPDQIGTGVFVTKWSHNIKS